MTTRPRRLFCRGCCCNAASGIKFTKQPRWRRRLPTALASARSSDVTQISAPGCNRTAGRGAAVSRGTARSTVRSRAAVVSGSARSKGTATVEVATSFRACSSSGGEAARKATICRRLCRVPRCSGLICGASGRRSCNADRISTRLIESMPRSASSAMSSSNISVG